MNTTNTTAPAPAAQVDKEGALQIISVSLDGTSFELHEKALDAVLRQVPDGVPVAIVSVVGAFRTGKSFLLDLFLRYLRWHDEHPDAGADDDRWLWGDDDRPLEGNAGSDAPLPAYSAIPPAAVAAAAAGGDDAVVGDGVAALPPPPRPHSAPHAAARAGFAWRGGRERMTTGIWLWSRPFVRRPPGGGPPVAVLLMDTQGLFDSETAQGLTTAIFGLSALLSSTLVYNLHKQVQEDALQHLALFAEYGRRVLEAQQAGGRARRGPAGAAAGAGTDGGALGSDSGAGGDAGAAAAADVPASPSTPFQRVELLVRDAVLRTIDVSDAPALAREMDEYLATVLSRSHNRDLAAVREQIRACFGDVSLYLLPHPGFDVAEESGPFDGSIRKIRDKFRTLVARYVRRLFCEHLAPKLIAGRAVTAPQLSRYVSAYATLFSERHGMPEAKMLLEATSDASNRIAVDAARAVFERAATELFSGPHVSDDEARALMDAAAESALAAFDDLANFGSDAGIARHRAELGDALVARRVECAVRNRERDPMRVLGPLVVALAVAVAAWLMRQIIELTCAPWLDVCRRGSQMFAFVYSAIVLALFAVGYAQRRVLARHTAFLTPLAAHAYRAALEAAGAGAAGPRVGGAADAHGVGAPPPSQAAADAPASASRAATPPDGDEGSASPGLSGASGVRRRVPRRA